MHEVHISKKDTKKMLEEVRRQLKIDVSRINDRGNKIIEIDKNANIILFGRIVLIKEEERIFPSLLCEETFLDQFPTIKVDKGAIPFICKGAKIMRPGIVAFDREFLLDDIVCVKEALYNKFIAIGKALMGKDDAEKGSKGVVLDNLHYVGDKYWDALKNIRFQ